MSSESDEMLALLQEVAEIKELNRVYESGGKSEEEQSAYEARQLRRMQITQEINRLAREAKGLTK